MKYIERNGARLSNMTLGTTQLGLNYGIANDSGMPGDEEGAELLRFAVSSGVTSIDTAQAYGVSEERIGRFLKDNKGPPPYITTKLRVGFGPTGSTGGKVLSADEISEIGDRCLAIGESLEKSIFESAENSLKKLNLSKADCIMLHDPVEMLAGGSRLAKIMSKLVTAGYAREVGASIYHPAEADAMMQYDVYTATQLPMSLFDQKMIHTGTLQKLRDRNTIVFVRSVFMQGVFFLDPGKVEDPLLTEYAVPHILQLRRLAGGEGVSVAQLAVSFVRDTSGVTSLVLGCETTAQILENIDLMEGPPVSERTMEAARQAFHDLNYEQIMTVLRRPKAQK